MTNNMKELGIEHVVVLMLENRGFDHVMGWLYEEEEKINLICNDKFKFNGLSSLSTEERKELSNLCPLSKQYIEPIKGTQSPAIPGFNHGEHFRHIMSHLWGPDDPDNPVNWEDPDVRARETFKRCYKNNEKVPMEGYCRILKEQLNTKLLQLQHLI
ncbi:MAG: alkaline phosphatase family protein [Candidatus Scalindua sp.]|jgi:phospholipase C|nr:alkaline phosphatase family protein [Candidatus Scalindua sp.]MDV5166671.1 alkaline phosphatase family protein [Candidatus Scalindua sp.]